MFCYISVYFPVQSATVGWDMWWFILAFSCPCVKGSEACIHKKLAKAHLKNNLAWFTGKDGETDRTETINDSTSSAEETTNGNPQYCSTKSSTEIPENVHTQLAYQMGECCGWWWWYQSLTAHQHQKGHTVPKQVSPLDDDDITESTRKKVMVLQLAGYDLVGYEMDWV